MIDNLLKQWAEETIGEFAFMQPSACDHDFPRWSWVEEIVTLSQSHWELLELFQTGFNLKAKKLVYK